MTSWGEEQQEDTKSKVIDRNNETKKFEEVKLNFYSDIYKGVIMDCN